MSPQVTADPADPRLIAAIDLLGRTGAKDFTIGYQDEVEPTVWFAMASWRNGSLKSHEAAGGMDPLTAAIRLLEMAIDGGQCAHCGKPAGVSDDWTRRMPLDQVVCWYVYDPELEKFRRSCEGETQGRQFTLDKDGKRVGRNDPCPCDSGLKFKVCHGR